MSMVGASAAAIETGIVPSINAKIATNRIDLGSRRNEVRRPRVERRA
ncbi:MAG: hypothetical protein ABW073_00280 [Acidimicrobiia bacterium]